MRISNIKLEIDDTATDIRIAMPYTALLRMMHVVTDRIRPDDLNNPDSIGELVLTEFIEQLLILNKEVLEEQEKHETETAIKEAEDIVGQAGHED